MACIIKAAMVEGTPDPTDAALHCAIATLRHGADRAIRMHVFADWAADGQEMMY